MPDDDALLRAMKVIIAGSRGVTDYKAVERAMKRSGFDVTEVFNGGADGVDALGARWARERRIVVRLFIAWWNVHGKAAGPMRNEEMAKEADALVAVWDGESRGTMDMIRRAEAHKLPMKVYVWQG